MANCDNKYYEGDNWGCDTDKIEWQSLQSYHLSPSDVERHSEDIIMDIGDDISQEVTETKQAIPDIGYASRGAKIRREDPVEEPDDVGCSEQWLHVQLQQMAALVMQGTEEFIRKVWRRGWGLVQHRYLPNWLKDNNFLVRSHRPQLHSFGRCFRSIFRVHTETVNIWTHLLGWLGFLAISVVVLAQPSDHLPWQDKVVMMCFFMGAVLCLGFSWLFHTVFCHSQRVGKIFNKLDYCGIAFLTVGSFVPWLYYSFYCRLTAKIVYLSLIVALGAFALVVSMFDKFATPPYRPLRAGVFVGLGLCGVVPCLHCVVVEGFWNSVHHSSVGWLSLMALAYISGAVIYAARIPERLLPGKFDIFLQSHQIFHVFVVLAALIHYYGIVLMSGYRLGEGDCAGPVSVVAL